MLNMDQKLIKRQEEGKIIKTGIVGAGQMGRGMVTQMVLMNGDSGFESQRTFNRVFKERYKISPSDYRSTCLKDMTVTSLAS